MEVEFDRLSSLDQLTAVILHQGRQIRQAPYNLYIGVY